MPFIIANCLILCSYRILFPGFSPWLVGTLCLTIEAIRFVRSARILQEHRFATKA